MAKKKKIGILSIILLCIAAVGVVLAVVGVAIAWFKPEVTSVVGSSSDSLGLFEKNLGKGIDFPVACVQAFALITLILGALACVCLLLKVLGVLKLNILPRLIGAGLVVVCAILTLIFAFVFAKDCGSADVGGLVSASVKVAAGGYLLPIGGILAGVPLILAKD